MHWKKSKKGCLSCFPQNSQSPGNIDERMTSHIKALCVTERPNFFHFDEKYTFASIKGRNRLDPEKIIIAELQNG